MAFKLATGGGVDVAGINVARSARKDHGGAKRDKKRSVLSPLYLKKGR
jgi:hypothetical protein